MHLTHWGFAMKNGKGLERGERLQIMLSLEELEVVDNFRFEHRLPSRAAAVRELFRLGLTVISNPQMTADRLSSKDYGVMREVAVMPAKGKTSRQPSE